MAYPITVVSNGVDWINLATGSPVATFTPGVTMPYYLETADYSGARNVGTKPGVTLTPYAGTVTNGVIQISDGALYENVLFTGQVEVRSAATFKNCRFVLPQTFLRTDVTKAVVLILNGAGAQNILFEDCEIHVRCQRPFNGIMGRNFTMLRSVVTGALDPWSESAGGLAPNTGFGFIVRDSIAPSVAMWYSPTINSDIHGDDTSSHSDAMQKNTTLTVEFENTVLAGFTSEFIGTGTPGSGSDAGNTYVPPSGYNYIATQSQMETWRTTFSAFTTPAQSMWGDSRRVWTDGSAVGVMLNLGGITLRKCYFGGGTVGINAIDPDIVASTVHLIDCTFWNDMTNGHGGNPATKGHAIIGSTAHTFGTFTGNRWAATIGGALLTRQLEGGYAIWR